MTPLPLDDTAELLAHAPWVRALARRLVGDTHAAEDLAQDVMVAAIAKPPEQRTNWRGWLAAVVANSARQLRRGERRRTARERAVAQPDARIDPTTDAVERAALHRELVDLVLELEEPFRSTVLLRFFDELDPREIARRQGIAVNTVHSRVARGIERLRGRLDARRGGRAAWVGALTPLAAPAGHAVGVASGMGTAGLWTGSGVLVMQAKAKITLATVVLLSVAALPLVFRDASRARQDGLPAASAAFDPGEGALTAVDAAASPRREVAPSPADVVTPVAPDEQRVALVFSADGRPLPQHDVEVRVEGKTVSRSPQRRARARARRDRRRP